MDEGNKKKEVGWEKYSHVRIGRYITIIYKKLISCVLVLVSIRYNLRSCMCFMGRQLVASSRERKSTSCHPVIGPLWPSFSNVDTRCLKPSAILYQLIT